jgi:localization factor PodJL
MLNEAGKDADFNSIRYSKNFTNLLSVKNPVQLQQIIMSRLGYDTGIKDGVMGLNTQSAISRFQKDKSLLQTGELDFKTLESLLKMPI